MNHIKKSQFNTDSCYFEPPEAVFIYFFLFSKQRLFQTVSPYKLIWCCEESSDQQTKIHPGEKPLLYLHQENTKMRRLTTKVLCIGWISMWRRRSIVWESMQTNGRRETDGFVNTAIVFSLTPKAIVALRSKHSCWIKLLRKIMYYESFLWWHILMFKLFGDLKAAGCTYQSDPSRLVSDNDQPVYIGPDQYIW